MYMTYLETLKETSYLFLQYTYLTFTSVLLNFTLGISNERSPSQYYRRTKVDFFL